MRRLYSEIAENGYNLNIPRYVDTFEPEERVELKPVAEKLFTLGKKIDEIDAVISVFCKELNIPEPKGYSIGLLELYKKGCMQKLFERELAFKDKNGKEYPECSEIKLGDVAKFKKGKGISKADILENGKNKCIRYGELIPNTMRLLMK